MCLLVITKAAFWMFDCMFACIFTIHCLWRKQRKVQSGREQKRLSSPQTHPYHMFYTSAAGHTGHVMWAQKRNHMETGERSR